MTKGFQVREARSDRQALNPSVAWWRLGESSIQSPALYRSRIHTATQGKHSFAGFNKERLVGTVVQKIDVGYTSHTELTPGNVTETEFF